MALFTNNVSVIVCRIVPTLDYSVGAFYLGVCDGHAFFSRAFLSGTLPNSVKVLDDIGKHFLQC